MARLLSSLCFATALAQGVPDAGISTGSIPSIRGSSGSSNGGRRGGGGGSGKCEEFFLLDGRASVDLPDTWAEARQAFRSLCEGDGTSRIDCAKIEMGLFATYPRDQGAFTPPEELCRKLEAHHISLHRVPKMLARRLTVWIHSSHCYSSCGPSSAEWALIFIFALFVPIFICFRKAWEGSAEQRAIQAAAASAPPVHRPQYMAQRAPPPPQGLHRPVGSPPLPLQALHRPCPLGTHHLERPSGEEAARWSNQVTQQAEQQQPEPEPEESGGEQPAAAPRSSSENSLESSLTRCRLGGVALAEAASSPLMATVHQRQHGPVHAKQATRSAR
eukprot:CAMPEP_0115218638 /NCGR_PEP_ID=MMETSP0270-20121206/26498_1 /TAXON_ID=71861 /ORGANISM="Scrippsiella trochoidea, Strain CCMP3099" /LENGTH=330 /DNA_ID=CAMNT_0002632595 /DNA_START=66 /DNA_END=1059 /DNA_ORIENTATION=+